MISRAFPRLGKEIFFYILKPFPEFLEMVLKCKKKKIVINRISSAVDGKLKEEQAGFRQGRGCID